MFAITNLCEFDLIVNSKPPFKSSACGLIAEAAEMIASLERNLLWLWGKMSKIETEAESNRRFTLIADVLLLVMAASSIILRHFFCPYEHRYRPRSRGGSGSKGRPIPYESRLETI